MKLIKIGRWTYKCIRTDDDKTYIECIDDPADWSYIDTSSIGFLYPIIGELNDEV